MKFRTKRADRIRSAFKMLCYNTIFEKRSRNEFISIKTEILESKDYKKLTGKEKSFWSGYCEAFIENIIFSHVEWAHLGNDGIYYNSEAFTEKYGKNIYQLPFFDCDKSGYVWKNSQKRF